MFQLLNLQSTNLAQFLQLVKEKALVTTTNIDVTDTRYSCAIAHEELTSGEQNREFNLNTL